MFKRPSFTYYKQKRLMAVSHKKDNQLESITLFLQSLHPLHNSTVQDTSPLWHYSESYRVEISRFKLQRTKVRTFIEFSHLFVTRSVFLPVCNVAKRPLGPVPSRLKTTCCYCQSEIRSAIIRSRFGEAL